MPQPIRPIRAIKKPMPAAMPTLRVLGMLLMTASRIFVSVSRMKMTPSTKIAASATCQEIFIESTTEKAKKAFSPIPVDRPIG